MKSVLPRDPVLSWLRCVCDARDVVLWQLEPGHSITSIDVLSNVHCQLSNTNSKPVSSQLVFSWNPHASNTFIILYSVWSARICSCVYCLSIGVGRT